MRIKREKERRLVAYLLAFVMLSGVITPFLGLQVARAAIPGQPHATTFDLHLPNDNQGMVVGTGSAAPEVIRVGGAPDTSASPRQAVMVWDFSAPEREYLLHLNIGDNRRVLFGVRRTHETALVTYITEHFIGGAWVPNTERSETGGLAIHSHYVHMQGYLSLEEFWTLPELGDNWRVLTTAPALAPELHSRPEFQIMEGNGFSFRYDGNYVHFLWDGSYFYLSISSLDLGNIYNFDFYYTTPDRTTIQVGTPQVRRQGFLGFSPTEFRSTPFASTDRFVEDVLDFTIGGADRVAGNYPGSDDVGLVLEIPLPRIWVDSENGFRTVPNAGYIQGDGEVNVSLNLTGVDELIHAHITDIFGGVGATLTGAGRGQTMVRRNEIVDGHIVLELSQMEAGRLYNASNINLAPSGHGIVLRAAPTVLSRPWIFTFMRYHLQFAEEDYELVVTTPYNIPGMYILRYNIGPAYVYFPLGVGPSTGEVPIRFPISRQMLWNPDGSRTMMTYQVIFIPDLPGVPLIPPMSPEAVRRESIFSQATLHEPTEAELGIGTPRYFEILSHELLPRTGDLLGNEGYLSMRLAWDIGTIGNIAGMIENQFNTTGTGEIVVYYSFARGLLPSPGDPFPADPQWGEFARVRMTITSDSALHPTSPGGLRATYDIYFYNWDEDREEAVWQAHGPQQVRRLDQGTGETAGRFIGYVHFDDFPAARVGFDGINPFVHQFLYPNVYFLNVRPMPGIFVNDGARESEPDTLTLSDIGRQQLPPPRDLRIAVDAAGEERIITTEEDNTLTEVSAALQWTVPLDHVRDYLRGFYGSFYEDEEMNIANNVEIWMNLYITQYEEHLRDEFLDYTRIQDRDAGSVGFVATPQALEARWYFSELGGGSPSLVVAGRNARDTLRVPNTIVQVHRIRLEGYDPFPALRRPGFALHDMIASGGSLLVTNILDGLDENQQYYVTVDLVVYHRGAIEGERHVASFFSELVGFTTRGILLVPDGLDRIPPAPGNLNSRDVTQDSVTVYWDRVNPTAENAFIEYEILRIVGEYLDPVLFNDNSSLPFQEFWEEDRLGLRTNEHEVWRVSDNNLYLFDGVNNFTQAAPDNEFEYRPLDTDIGPNIASLRDLTLRPNNLYFYYVRTVQIIVDANGNIIQEMYSQWSHTAVTTFPVRPPRNLRVELEYEDYDPLTEIVISFDGPISNIEELHNTIDFQFQLREEGEGWGTPQTMDSYLSVEGPDRYGYFRFMYRITGLSPGRSYSVRVRTLDITSGDSSLYSNVVDFRTEFDQDDYDRDRDTDDWENRLRELLRDLLRNPYWVTRHTRYNYEVVFRANRFDELIRTAVGGAIVLPEPQADRAVYYIPAISYIAANRANIGFSVTHGDMQVIIPASTINTDINHAALELTQLMNNREVADYFVRITLDWREISYVDGEETLTDQVEIEFDLVSANQNIPAWDNIVTDLATQHILNAVNETTREAIYNRIRERPPNLEMAHLINNIVEQEHQRLMDLIEEELWQVTEGTIIVGDLDSSMRIIAREFDDATVILAYRLVNGVWLPVEVIDFGDARGIFTNRPGTYVFTGRVINIPGFETERHAGNVTAIIARHGLDDLFGREMIDIHANSTRMMVAGSVARIAGAPRAANPFDWLNNAGVNISARNPNAYITQQEAVHMLMVAYQNRTGTNIQTLRITNFGAIANVQNLDDRYRQSVSAALQLGLFTDSNFNARGQISIRELFNMLGTLDARLNF